MVIVVVRWVVVVVMHDEEMQGVAEYKSGEEESDDRKEDAGD